MMNEQYVPQLQVRFQYYGAAQRRWLCQWGLVSGPQRCLRRYNPTRSNAPLPTNPTLSAYQWWLCQWDVVLRPQRYLRLIALMIQAHMIVGLDRMPEGVDNG